MSRQTKQIGNEQAACRPLAAVASALAQRSLSIGIETMELLHLSSWDSEKRLRVVIETPKGSACKVRYDEGTRAFTFQRPLPDHRVYPYDWGFIPGTLAEDGDPLDALVIHDAPTWPGVVIPSTPIALLRVSERKSPGESERQNNRVIAVPDGHLNSPAVLSEATKRLIGEFLLAVGRQIKLVELRGWGDGNEARAEITRASGRFRDK